MPRRPRGARALAPLESALLAQVGAFRRAVPVAVLARLLGVDPADAAAGIARLERRLLVARPETDLVATDGVIRTALARAGRGPTAREHGRCVAYYQ